MVERRSKKSVWKSLTIWLNSVQGAALAMMLTAQESLTILQPVLTVEFYQWWLFALTVINVGLRFRTTQGVGR